MPMGAGGNLVVICFGANVSFVIKIVIIWPVFGLIFKIQMPEQLTTHLEHIQF